MRGFRPEQGNRRRAWLLRLCVAALLLSASLSAAPVQAAPARQGGEPVVTPSTPVAKGETLAGCSEVDETALLDELNTVSQNALAVALAEVDIAAAVDRQWARLNVDTVVEAEVDRAVTRVQSETDLWNTFLSGWSAAKARELTLAVANYAFDSEGFRTSMDALANAVAEDISAQVGVLSAESVSAALYCLQTFIEGNYSQALLASFQDELQAGTAATALESDAYAPGLLSVIDQHRLALGGIGVIIAAQISKRIVVAISKRIATRVAGRITGRVLGRIGTTVIPLAGWLIGAGLIAYDIYDSLDGALPQIQETLKSPEVMEGIRGEIAAAVAPELALELPTIARDIANDLYGQWLDVKRDIRVVLELAAEDAAFAGVLGSMTTDAQLSHLVNIVGAALPALGRAGVLAAAQDGTLERAAALSADVTPILAAGGSLQEAVAWAESAGDLLDEVIAFELYKHKAPGDLTRDQLAQLVALGDRDAVARLALLPAGQLAPLLAVAQPTLVTLAQQLDADDLAWLAETLPTLEAGERNALVARLATDPATLALVQQSNVLAELEPGENLDAALVFLAGPRDAGGLAADVAQVVSGPPTVRHFRIKYGWTTTLLTGLALLLLALVALRIVYGLVLWLLAPMRAVLPRRRER